MNFKLFVNNMNPQKMNPSKFLSVLNVYKNHHIKHCSNFCKTPYIVTLVGAGYPTGKLAAMLLKQNKLIRELRLHSCEDICGTAIDISHIDSSPRVRAYIGPELLKDAVENSSVIVVVGQSKVRPGETEQEIFDKNAPYVRTIAMYASEFAKDAVFCIGCPPVNSLVPMVSEEYKKAREYNPKKIIGITNLVAIRLNSIIACYTHQDACRVTCPVIGGFCPFSSVAVLSQAKPCGDFPARIAKNIQAKLARADDDVLELKCAEGNPYGLYLSQAFAISRFVNHLSQAMEGVRQPTEYAFVKQEGSIESFLPYMLSVVKLDCEGVESTHMPKINDMECTLLQNAAIAIQNAINLGSSFVSGETSKRPKREPEMPAYCKKPDAGVTDSHGFEILDKIPFSGKQCPGGG